MFSKCLYSSVAERWSCKPKVMSSILIGGKPFFSDFLVKLTVTQIVACRQYLRQKFKKNIFDPDVIWTRSLLIWSQTRYRCATESLYTKVQKYMTGSTEIWTRIAGFKVQSANHYTIEPYLQFDGIKLKLPKHVHGESYGCWVTVL